MNIEEFVNYYLQEHHHDVLLNPYNGLIDFANAFKEQMMKDAVERMVKTDSGGYPYIDITTELYDYEHDVPLAKEGELVKIIIVKEDEK